MLLAGGIKPGQMMERTGYRFVEDPFHAHDRNATILHCRGLDHARLTYGFPGREFRLTDGEGNVIRGAVAHRTPEGAGC